MKGQGDKHFFMMRGHLGQYVLVEPNDNIIIVRLGHQNQKMLELVNFQMTLQYILKKPIK